MGLRAKWAVFKAGYDHGRAMERESTQPLSTLRYSLIALLAVTFTLVVGVLLAVILLVGAVVTWQLFAWWI